MDGTFGAGAASRHSLGTGVIGGMLGATVLAIIFIPLFYRLIEELSQRLATRRNRSADSRALALG